jgi:putative ABC transport system permease protein
MERLFAETIDLEKQRLGWLAHITVWFAAAGDVLRASAESVSTPHTHGTSHMPEPQRFGAVVQDLKYGLRGLMRNRGFTLVAVITLALGIGANTAIFTVVNNVVLAPLAYDAPEQLVRIHTTLAQNTTGRLSALDARDYAEQSASMAQVAVLDWGSLDLTGDGNPTVLSSGNVSTNFFAMLRTRPGLGRLFLPEDGIAGNDRVAVISNNLWRRRFAADPDRVGGTIALGGTPYTVIGVLPADFEDPSASGVGGTDVWLPLPLTSSGSRDTRWLHGFARLAEGVTLEQAERELGGVAAALADEYPDSNAPEMGVRLLPLQSAIWGDFPALLFVLLAATGFVLLIACANIASLVLARGASRMREIALRAALGAGRTQIVRLLFVESLLLSVIAGGVGLATASFLFGGLSDLAGSQMSRVSEAGIDFRVLAFSLLVSLGTAVAFGLLPAIKISKAGPRGALAEGGRGAGGSSKGRRVRSYLVVAQMAASLVLLIGAGLMVRSFNRLLTVDTGWDRENVLTFQLSLPRSRYDGGGEITLFQEALVQRLAALPGVRTAGAIDKLPLGTRWGCNGLAVGDRPLPTGRDWPCVEPRAASPEYFDAMGIAVLRGRTFTDADRSVAAPVVVVNETMAQRFWPDQDPVGQRVKWVNDVTNDLPWRTVVGMVEDIKHQGLEVAAQAEAYMPLAQAPDRRISFVVKSFAKDAGLLTLAQSAVHELDPDLPLRSTQTMQETVSSAVAGPRLAAMLIALLAGVALLLSVVGNYGVL